MAILSRDQILRAVDLPVEEVSVPEWGGSVLVQGMTGTMRDQFDAFLIQHKPDDIIDLTGLRAKLVSMCVVDEAGGPVFTEKDLDALGRKSATALQRVYDVAQRLSGIGEDQVEAAVKN